MKTVKSLYLRNGSTYHRETFVLLILPAVKISKL